jgi:predicted PurR-regulated permease PerM
VSTSRAELVGSLFLVLCVGALVAGAFSVLRPFLPALVWASIIAVATWPVLDRLQVWCGGRRRLAIALLSLVLFIVIVVPVTWLITTLITHAPEFGDLVSRWITGPTPAPPAWLLRLPFGERLAQEWQEVFAKSPGSWAEQLRPYALNSVQWIGSHIGTVGSLMLEFLLTMVLVVVLYVHGEALAAWVRVAARRIGGARGEASVLLAGGAMGAIAAGVVLTALAQALLSGLGLWICGVPAAAVLMSLAFVLCIVQLGPLLVLVPAIAWLFWRGDTGWGIALTVWSVALSTGDSILRSYLIQRGAKLPFMLILAGVIGGLLAFGVVGIFIGPIVLAVSTRLLKSWAASGDEAMNET